MHELITTLFAIILCIVGFIFAVAIILMPIFIAGIYFQLVKLNKAIKP
jgi:uncharacterized protein YqhQ